jgi:hypothetical protein
MHQPRPGGWRPHLALVMLAASTFLVGCSGAPNPAAGGPTPTSAGSAVCELPLGGPAAAAACEGAASVISRTDASSGGRSGLVYRIAIPDQEPTIIMAAITKAALDHRGEADEVTFLAYGDATEASGNAYTRGRLLVQADGTAAYDVCTAWSESGGKTVCADQIQFTVVIFD